MHTELRITQYTHMRWRGNGMWQMSPTSRCYRAAESQGVHEHHVPGVGAHVLKSLHHSIPVFIFSMHACMYFLTGFITPTLWTKPNKWTWTWTPQMTLQNSSTNRTQEKYDVSTADVLKCPLGVAIWNDRIKPPSALLAFITVLWMWGPKVSLVSRVTPKSRIVFTCSKAVFLTK